MAPVRAGYHMAADVLYWGFVQHTGVIQALNGNKHFAYFMSE